MEAEKLIMMIIYKTLMQAVEDCYKVQPQVLCCMTILLLIGELKTPWLPWKIKEDAVPVGFSALLVLLKDCGQSLMLGYIDFQNNIC